MQYKRIYIALGTTAIEGMKHFILRLMEENIYSDSESYFLGIDSDINFLKTLQSLDSNRDKVETIGLTLSPDDYTSRFVRTIHPSWPKSISGAGVGGDRRLSFTSLNWNSRLEVIFKKLDAESEVYLIGSAFGGTSTGVFWNMSHFIREQVSKITKDHKWEKEPLFNSLLLFPKSQRFGEKGYPLGRNICAFLKEMQTIVWNRRLFEECKDKLTFKNVNYCTLTKDSFVPLIHDYTEGRAKTKVPFDTIYLIPTPLKDKSYQKEAVTEVLLILSKHGIASKVPGFAVDLSTDGRAISRDEKFFGCLNIIVARNAKNTSIKKFAYGLLKIRWDAFQNSTSIGDDYDWVSKYIVKLMGAEKDNASNNVLFERNNEVKDIDFKRNITDLRNELPKILSDLEKLSDACPYKWPSADELIKELSKASSDTDAPDSLSLDGICQAYNSKIEHINKMSGATDSLKMKMTELAEKASKIINRRKVSKIAKVLNATKIVQKEVEEKLASGLSQVLDIYLDGCRCKATVKLGRLTKQIKAEDFYSDARFQKITQTINDKLSVTASSHAEFIYEDAGKNHDGSLQMIDTSKIKFNKPVIDALSAELSEFDAIFGEFEGTAIATINKVASDKGAANPLKDMKTNLSLRDLTSYIPSFSISETRYFDLSFLIQGGAAQNTDGTPITIGDLNGKFPSFNKDIDANYQNPIDKYKREDDKNWTIRVAKNAAELSGIWMGTLSLENSISEILSKLYDREIARTWANDASDDERTDQYRLFTLKQSLFTGIILGVIEEKMKEDMARGNKVLDAVDKMTVKISKTDNDFFSLEPVKPRDVFANDADGIRMTNCRASWLKGMFSWFSSSFEADLGVKGADKLGGQLMQENSIFDNIGFGIQEHILNGLRDLSAELRKRVKIELKD